MTVSNMSVRSGQCDKGKDAMPHSQWLFKHQLECALPSFFCCSGPCRRSYGSRPKSQQFSLYKSSPQAESNYLWIQNIVGVKCLELTSCLHNSRSRACILDWCSTRASSSAFLRDISSSRSHSSRDFSASSSLSRSASFSPASQQHQYHNNDYLVLNLLNCRCRNVKNIAGGSWRCNPPTYGRGR